MTSPDLLLRLDEIDNLPTLPVVVRQIQKLIANPHSSMAQIAQVISRDQAITSRVIRLVNSAYYGLGGRVSSIQQAIVILGLNTVKNLVLGVSIVKTFERHGSASLFDREELWKHSFAVALGAKMMAQKAKKPESEDYFISGLLHDIGILVLDQFFHDELVSVVKRALLDKIDYPEAEFQVLGLTHSEIGAALAGKWQIPLFIADTIRFHHRPLLGKPEHPDSPDKIMIVHVADGMARKKGLGRFCSQWKKGFEDDALARTGFLQADLDDLFEKVEAEVKNLMREWEM
ncbi:MAG: HDOD domain-containing protein [Fibrobacterota bacterium]